MRKALVIGIDDYPSSPLRGCVNDATEMKILLERDGDGSPNFSVRDIISDSSKITRQLLQSEITNLFSGEPDVALFYFAGHGCLNSYGGHIITPELTQYADGVSMDDLLKVANQSKARNKIIILDCCMSGNMGSPAVSEGVYTQLANGVTILTACNADETAAEKDGHGIFTSLLLDALQGGSADLLGHISPGSIYAYVDRALGPWGQRPVFKTNVSQFVSLRNVEPPIETAILRNITKYFNNPYDNYKLDPTFEFTHESNKPENVTILKQLQKMESVGLVTPVDAEHMYFAAINSKSCKLTAMGMQYWELVDSGNI